MNCCGAIDTLVHSFNIHFLLFLLYNVFVIICNLNNFDILRICSLNLSNVCNYNPVSLSDAIFKIMFAVIRVKHKLSSIILLNSNGVFCDFHKSSDCCFFRLTGSCSSLVFYRYYFNIGSICSLNLSFIVNHKFVPRKHIHSIYRCLGNIKLIFLLLRFNHKVCS